MTEARGRTSVGFLAASYVMSVLFPVAGLGMAVALWDNARHRHATGVACLSVGFLTLYVLATLNGW